MSNTEYRAVAGIDYKYPKEKPEEERQEEKPKKIKDAEKKDSVKRNKEHLELMIAKTDWGSEDMTAANSAITAATTYLG